MGDFIDIDCLCANCGKQLAARPVKNPNSFSIKGLRALEYIHADGTAECIIVKKPGPYDAFYGARLFDDAKQRIWDDELAAERAGGGDQ